MIRARAHGCVKVQAYMHETWIQYWYHNKTKYNKVKLYV